MWICQIGVGFALYLTDYDWFVAGDRTLAAPLPFFWWNL
jgi:hypothetical protein